MKKKKLSHLPRNKRPITSKIAGAALAVTMLGTATQVIPMNNNLVQVADAATVGSSVSSTSIPALEAASVKVIDIDKLGADPTGQKDSSEIFHDALQESEKEPIKILMSKDAHYKLDSTHNIEVLNSKGVYFQGDNSVIDYKNDKTTNLPEFYAFQLHMDKADNAGVKIDGVVFDGHRNEQNLFFTFNETNMNGYGGDVSGFYKTRLAKGVFIGHAHDLAVTNTTFQNAYGGYSLIAEGYNNVNYDNITIKNVGGDGQTDSLGMFLYFGGHEGDATVNINNVQATGKIGDGPQSNAGTGFKNPGDPSYFSWIGVVTGENGSIQSTDPANWLVDKNTTFNITNSTFDNVETTFHTESMAGNVAVNVNNVNTHTKQLAISAGIKGKYKFVGNKMNIQHEPYGRNSVYSSLFSSEFGDDSRYHNGYNANLTDANGGAPLHTSLLTNSYVNELIRDKTPVGAPGSKDVYASIAYGNQVNANLKCVQVDNLWNKMYANGGGTIEKSVFNLWENNPNPATYAGVKGDPGAAGALASVDSETTFNKAGEWKNITATCATPTFNDFSGNPAPSLDDPMIPAPIGGTEPGTPVDPIENVAPKIEAPAVTITEGDSFDPMQGVTVSDDTDAIITPEVSGSVDTSKPGKYTLTYTATDSKGAKTTKERVVTVVAKDVPTTEEPTTEKPTTEAPTTEKPTTEDATTEKPTTEKPTTEAPTTEGPVVTPNPDGSYSIKGSVFQDKNFDGFFSPDSEGKVKNFKVIAKDASGNQVGEAMTDNQGNYSINGLKPGTYAVSFMASSLEYAPTYANQDLNVSDDRDSDGPTDALVTIVDKDVLHVDQGYLNLPADADLTVPGETEQPTTEEPTTEAPTTETPTTEAPTTETPKTNQKPRIFAYDQFVAEGSAYDEMDNVRAFDHEDGDLTDKVKLKSGKVDTSKPGSYDLTYTVEDEDKNVSERTITVVVANDWSDDIQALQDKQEAMQKQIDDLIKGYEELSDKADGLDTRVSALEDKVDEIISTLDSIDKQMDELNKAIEAINAKYDGMKVDVDALKADVKAAQDRLDKIEKSVTELNTKYAELVKIVDQNTKDIGSLKDDVSALKDDTAGLKDQVSALDKQVKDLQSKVDKLVSEVGKGSVTIINNNKVEVQKGEKPTTEKPSTETPASGKGSGKTLPNTGGNTDIFDEIAQFFL